MRHYFNLFICVLPFVFSGCGSKDKADTTPPKPSAETIAKESSQSSVKQSLFDDSILTDGLQATLKLAAERAVEELSKPGAFANSEVLRIHLPESFAPVKSGLKKLGQEKLVTDFENSMNEAAGKSVMASPKILGETIQGMKMEDVLSIWKGGEDAATRYLENQTRSKIEEQMLPIIAKQTTESGSTKYFQQIVDLIPKKQEGLLGNLSSITGMKIPEDFDLNQYVSDNALNALYAKLAVEETKIRENPAARTTELVKNAFDYFKKQ